MPAELNWTHKADNIPAAGLDRSCQASEVERAAIAETLELLALKRLDVRYHIRPVRRDRFLLQGDLSADVEQACSVSLDPVVTTLAAQIEVEFWPEDKLPKQAVVSEDEAVFDPFAADDPEPLSAGKIEVGRIVFEQLASAIEPYPRLGEVTLEQDQSPVAGADSATSGADNPFAVLSKLKVDEE